MKNSRCVWSIAVGFVGFTVGIGRSAIADISQATITSPGGFIQAGVYQSTCSCNLIPGAGMAATFGTGEDFHELAFSGMSSAQASAAFSGGGITNSASGTAEMGRARMMTSNTCPNSASFAAGNTNGGWKETFTVSHPSLNGQAGFMVFQIRARGTMNATGFAGAASIQTTGYKDNLELSVDPLFDPGNSDPTGSDRQRAQWGLASDVLPESRTVDGTVTMAVPITFGQSFTLGIYALAHSGQRSSSGAFGSSTGMLDFSGDGLTWNGITSVQSGGQPVSGHTVISATGIDWSQPFAVCCPADFNCDGSLNSQDFFNFLNAFFANDPSADFNHDGAVNSQDFFDFLNAFFDGCP
jgi:hypothetical protein